MFKRKLLLLFALLFLCSCIRSLHPIYSEDTEEFKIELIGKWMEEGEKDYWFFSPVDDSYYKLIVSDEGKIQGPFEAHLCKIDDAYFLDLYPDEETIKDGFFNFHFLPVHSFIYVEQVEPVLKMQFVNTEWLRELLKASPNDIQHEIVDDEVILTAATPELQKFWAKHIATDDAFGESSNLIKME